MFKCALGCLLGGFVVGTLVYADFPRADGSRRDHVIVEQTARYHLDVRYPILSSPTLNNVIFTYVSNQLSAFQGRISEAPPHQVPVTFRLRCRIDPGFDDLINLTFTSNISTGSFGSKETVHTMVFHKETGIQVTFEDVFRPGPDTMTQLNVQTLKQLAPFVGPTPNLVTADFQNFVLLPTAIQFYFDYPVVRSLHENPYSVRILYRDLAPEFWGIQPYPEPALKDYVFSRLISGFDDYPTYLTSPLRWNSEQWRTAGTVMGITALLFIVDEPIFYAFPQQNLRAEPSLLRPFFELGDWERATNFLEFSWAFSVLVQDTKLRNATELAVKSLILEALVTQTLKNVLNRRVAGTVVEFPGPIWELPSSGGLPSGHAAIAWSILTSYAEGYRGDPVIPPLCYTAAVISSFTLITTHSHWVSDIFMGAAIGYYTAQATVWLNQERANILIHPVLSQQGPGLAVSLQF